MSGAVGTSGSVDNGVLSGDASAQASLVRDNAIDPVGLLAASLRRIEEVNPLVNAVINVDEDHARRRIADLTGSEPFAGVPFLYKDLGSGEAGMPFTMGSLALRDAKNKHAADSPFAKRLKALGLVAVGTTNSCEFGIQSTTQPFAYGPTRNPWDTDLSTGGSSGGSAVAVATGMVAIAHGTDTAGSLRIPATWCGVSTLKVSRGSIPLATEIDRNRTEFVLARSIRDLETVFTATAGVRPEDLYGSPCPPNPARSDRPLRVGVQLSLPGIDVDDEVADAVKQAAALLADHGFEVFDASLPLTDPASAQAGLTYTRSLLRSNLGDVSTLLKRPLRDDEVEPFTRSLAFDGPEPTGKDLFDAMKVLQRHAVEISRRWSEQGVDILLTPGVPTLPMTLSELVPPSSDPMAVRGKFAQIWSFVRAFNQTGQPAIAMPVARSKKMLPIGVQLVAERGQELTLLTVARALEAAVALAPLWPTLKRGEVT